MGFVNIKRVQACCMLPPYLRMKRELDLSSIALSRGSASYATLLPHRPAGSQSSCLRHTLPRTIPELEKMKSPTRRLVVQCCELVSATCSPCYSIPKRERRQRWMFDRIPCRSERKSTFAPCLETQTASPSDGITSAAVSPADPKVLEPGPSCHQKRQYKPLRVQIK